MPAFKTTEQADKDKLEKSASFSLKNADRDLNELEEEAEQKAVKFSLQTYKRIKPTFGTLGFLLRNIRGGNDAVIQSLEWAQQGENGKGGGRTKFIKDFLILWENMDEFSRRRVDIFDILCRKYSVSLKRFWGIFQEGIFDYNEQITQTALSGYKPEFVELMQRMAAKERHYQDRRLLGEALKLTGVEPLIKIEDNSQTVNVSNLNQFPSFTASIKRSEQGIRHKDIAVPKQLIEGETNFIDADWIEKEEKELVELSIKESDI